MKKLLTLILMGLLVNLLTVNFIYANSEKDARFAEKIKKSVFSLGTGEQARIEVKLRDKTKLKGYVREAGNDDFTVVDKNTGVASTVSYPQVRQVKGNNLSTGAKIAIGFGIGLGVALLIAWIISASDD